MNELEKYLKKIAGSKEEKKGRLTERGNQSLQGKKIDNVKPSREEQYRGKE